MKTTSYSTVCLSRCSITVTAQPLMHYSYTAATALTLEHTSYALHATACTHATSSTRVLSNLSDRLVPSAQ
jgi:hypothetical protein